VAVGIAAQVSRPELGPEWQLRPFVQYNVGLGMIWGSVGRVDMLVGAFDAFDTVLTTLRIVIAYYV
jgi:hypothetical protein